MTTKAWIDLLEQQNAEIKKLLEDLIKNSASKHGPTPTTHRRETGQQAVQRRKKLWGKFYGKNQ
jgi:hypothetical protein